MASAKVSGLREEVLAPVAPEERIGTLDILRGFAMFGVMWSNLHYWYGGPSAVTSLTGGSRG
jgi:uncharacterized membrane protein YeiB